MSYDTGREAASGPAASEKNIAAAIQATGLSKCYQLYNTPRDRLKQFLWRGRRQYYRELWALQNIDLTVSHGEVVGIVGQNGSGKSTLLQLICGTLTPTSGEISVEGRVAALLELGAGFNPEFTGRENIYMNAAILGLSQSEIEDRIDRIIDFSGIHDFIDQPVKTYSSGMFVRLAFSVAINVDPEILVIDEALSVGDGAFSRKSFNRIMQLRDAGKTILFCSHSMFQVESLCSRAIWIDQGRMMADDEAARVVADYQTFLDKSAATQNGGTVTITPQAGKTPPPAEPVQFSPGRARLKTVRILADGRDYKSTPIISGQSTLSVQITFLSDPELPCPNIAITIHSMDARTITSAATWEDHITPVRQQDGTGGICLTIDQLPLLKGEYFVSVHLLCERGIHIYESAKAIATFQVDQEGRLQGYFRLAHRWEKDTHFPHDNP
ncbi:lipopolysaccharide transport system ATP-binding protein [Nitrosomonas marina]|uniref:Lipopolysaccharide transport system ATP-binding protein n=1 Tax=Nitrosomonas marina TaxID=917 RepID=A0A1I0CUT5_9PROT|nr:ABC transporter ATP-binding protein [Nitrosomonas marina]SET22866.1 lipopolysaccharide transport system ATP-binding protein [Nitrosomonas marina]